MVEIECPLCAETIDLGMAEEGEYECPYCEDVFHWEPDNFSDIKYLQCPKGCGQLSGVVNVKDEIRHYECQKCKGSLLNNKNIRAILKDNLDKVETLESLLEQGVPCDLDCPTCEGKMVEIKVHYEPPNPLDSIAIYSHDWFEVVFAHVIALPGIAYEYSKHNYEGGKATLILDGCGNCESFWFDKGEIDKIRNPVESDDEDLEVKEFWESADDASDELERKINDKIKQLKGRIGIR